MRRSADRVRSRRTTSIGHAVGLVGVTTLLHACTPPSSVTHAPASTPAAAAAQPSNPTSDPLAELDAIIQRDPEHHGAIYHAARVASKAGDAERALRYLERLSKTRFDDALEDADFKGLVDRADYRALAETFARRAPPVGHMRLLETDCVDVLPEGTAYDPKRKDLLLSSGHRRTVMAVAENGKCRELVPPGDGGLLAVLGMRVESRRDALWVASTAAPFMRDAASVPGGSALLARIDLAAGRVVATYPLPRPGMLNDVALSPDGRVYVTDSQGGNVYWVDPDAVTPGLHALFGQPTFEGINGIVELTSRRLLVAHFDGLSLIELSEGSAPRALRLATPEGRYLGGIDGLASDGARFVAIQNLVGRGRVWQFRVDVEGARITDLELLARGHEDFRNPTTGVVLDGRFMFVADPNLQTFENGALSPLLAGRSGHRVASVSLLDR